MVRSFVLAGVAGVMSATAAISDENKYEITTIEKAACTTDAVRLCSHVYPDQDRLLDCLRTNVSNLSLVCATTFKAGLRRRHIPL